MEDWSESDGQKSIMKTLIKNQKGVVSILMTILIVLVVNSTSYADVTSVSQRTPQVRDAIVAAVPGVNNAADVTEAHLAAITSLQLRHKGISMLKTNDFSGLTALTSLNLYNNQLSHLPNGIFKGLISLTTIRLGRNVIDPLPLTISLEKVAEGQFKAVAPTGATFDFVIPITVSNGTITNGATSVTIPKGSAESETLTVTRTAGTTAHVTADIGALPNLPRKHYGYTLVKSDNLPLVVIRGINIVPVFSDGTTTTRSVAENTASGVNIGAPVSATNADNDTLTYILSGIDAASFDMDRTTGQLKTKAALDSETQIFYLVTVAVSDGYGGSDSIIVTINVTDVHENRAPIFTEGTRTARSITENTSPGQNIGTAITATDVDNDTLTYTLSGTDAAAFNINSKTGQIKTKASLDYETKNNYTVRLTVSDGLATDTIVVTINVTDVHENRAPVFTEGESTTRTIAENTARGVNIGDAVAATDQDAKDTLTYTLGGTDAASFNINSNRGQIKTKTALDYETKNSYTVTLTVSDGQATDTIAVTINVTDIDENRAPVFIEGESTTRTIAENTARGVNIGDAVAATDQDAKDTLTYTLGGTDAASFNINSNRGQIKTKTALDYETKNSYTVTLTVSDGQATDTIAVTINVTDIDENRAPVFTEGSSATRTVAENTAAGTNIGNAITATDPDNDTLTYSLGGQDASAFGIDTTTGQLRTNAALDYETKSIYTVSVTVSDGKLTTTIAVTINITDVDELPNQVIEVKGVSANNAPVFTEGSSTSRSVAENTGSGVDIGGAVSATDADGHTLTYSLGGTDTNAFSIDTTTGQLRTDATLDYETKSIYTVTITASDGTDEATITVTINVIDETENRAPVFTDGSSTSRSVAENTGSGVDIGRAVSATDADGHTLTYSLGGTDAAAFTINSTTGQLRTHTELDYETKSIYTVIITASDSTDEATITVTIKVIDETENRAPVFTDGNSSSRSVAENTGSGVDIGSAISATDADGNTLTYFLSGTDANAFSIDNTTGQLRTNAALNYEAKIAYVVTITVSDGNLTDSINVTINVKDVSDTNNVPVFTEGTSTTRSVAENAADGTNIGRPVSATDPDNDDLTYTLGGTDSYAFYIVNTTGQLQTSTALDYETKNTYTVTVSVSDSNGDSDSITVTINVTDVTAPNYPLYGRTQQVQDAIAGGQPADSVTAARLADINWLEIENKGITALKAGDFDGLTALKTLNLRRNSLSNISALGNLTTLLSLSLGENSISDISPLGKLTKLDFLSLGENSISGISALGNLTKLTNLGLSYNSISDISPLGNLTALTELSLWNNSIGDVSTLGKLTALTSLYLSHNSIGDISPLGKLTKLAILDLSHNSIGDISPLGKLTKLDFLSLGHNSISDISSVGKLTALTKLGLYNNSISDISAVGSLTALIWLDMSHNSISDVSAVENLTQLGALFVKGNPISDYGPLRRLKAANPNVSIDIDINNNPPQFNDGDSTTRSIAENSTAGIDIGSAVSATDSDSGDTLTYTLGGTDAESFGIVSTSGQLQTKAALDYETKSSYTVTVDVSDGNDGLDRITVTINITDVVGAAPSVQTSLVIPDNTALLTNFPNPFNPETWIPYQLAKPSDVTITIYDIHGRVVRTLILGHQAAGVYQSRSKAAHWDGHNHFGEKVAAGVYFYTLTAGNFTVTRKMLIRK